MKAKPPCKRNCARRGSGCATACPEWAEYVKVRNQDYARRLEKKRVSDAICEGYARLSKMANR